MARRSDRLAAGKPIEDHGKLRAGHAIVRAEKAQPAADVRAAHQAVRHNIIYRRNVPVVDRNIRKDIHGLLTVLLDLELHSAALRLRHHAELQLRGQLRLAALLRKALTVRRIALLVFLPAAARHDQNDQHHEQQQDHK